VTEGLAGARIAITGGAGFIGSTLAERLSRDPSTTLVLVDNLHRNAIEGTDLLARRNVSLVRADVCDRGALEAALCGATHVVHMASIAGVDTVMRRPIDTMRVSMLGTMNALEIAAQMPGLRRFVDFSTSEVFGRYAFQVSEGDVTSLGAVGEARWTYAVAKLASEHMTFNYWKQLGAPTVSVRPFNIYGPSQVGEGAVHHFIVRALRGDDLNIHNDGSQIRAWCYIDDIIDGVLAVLTRQEAVGHAFNIGNPRSTVTIHQLARDIVRLAGSTSKIVFVPWSFPDVDLRIPNIDKARSLLGFEPQVDLEEGLARTIAWYRAKAGGAR